MSDIRMDAAFLLLQAQADGRVVETRSADGRTWKATSLNLHGMSIGWIMANLPDLRIRPAKKPKKPNRRYYVYFHQINQQRYEVVAKSEHAAAMKAERQWKRDYSYQTACSIEPVTDADNQ